MLSYEPPGFGLTLLLPDDWSAETVTPVIVVAHPKKVSASDWRFLPFSILVRNLPLLSEPDVHSLMVRRGGWEREGSRGSCRWDVPTQEFDWTDGVLDVYSCFSHRSSQTVEISLARDPQWARSLEASATELGPLSMVIGRFLHVRWSNV